MKPPAYILPLSLIVLFLSFYCLILSIKTDKLKICDQPVSNDVFSKSLNDKIQSLDEQLRKMNLQIEETKERTRLIALAHNENLEIIRKATKTKDLIFIEKNWKINRMPKELVLTQEEKEVIQKKYIN